MIVSCEVILTLSRTVRGCTSEVVTYPKLIIREVMFDEFRLLLFKLAGPLRQRVILNSLLAYHIEVCCPHEPLARL